MSEITLVLVGKSGNGKSSTGNTILQNMAFQEATAMSDGSELLQLQKGRLENGTQIKVYDTPGLGSVVRTEEQINEELHRLMSQAKKIDVFCFVYSFTSQFTREEVWAVEQLREKFGRNFLRNNGIVVVTHGDNCKMKAKEKGIHTKAMFNKWCISAGPAFDKLITEVGGKVLLVNNKGDFSRNGRRFKSSCELQTMIKEVAYSSRPFTKSDYDNLSSCTIM